MKTINVAFDAGPLSSSHSVRGIGFYTRELVGVLRANEKKYKDVKIDFLDFSKDRELLTSGKYDIVHYSSFNPFLITLPYKKPAKLVVTIHDLIPLIYPKHYPPGIKGIMRFFVQKYLVRKADAIVTISETSKKDIVRFLDVLPETVRVVYGGAVSDYKEISDKTKLRAVSEKYKLPSKFVFYLGDVNYNKNIPNLVKACKIAKIPLVIVGKHAVQIEENLETSLRYLKGPQDWLRFIFGKPHPEMAHYKELLKLFANHKLVYRLGFVSDEDAVAICNLATVYCHPSYYEGLGLGVLNAFACKTPVVISKTQALMEVSEDAALASDPNSPEKLAKNILEAENNKPKRNKLIKAGLERLKFFNWEKTTDEMIELYRQIGG